jgi:hypothetical protein
MMTAAMANGIAIQTGNMKAATTITILIRAAAAIMPMIIIRNDRHRYRERRLETNDHSIADAMKKILYRRSDGTTGGSGSVVGGLRQCIITGRFQTLGTIGVIGGAVAGRAIDRGGKNDEIRCR